MEREKRNQTTELIGECVGTLKKKYPNWSSAQIAKSIGISRATFNRLENGTTNPSLDSLMRLILSSGKICKLSEFLDSLKVRDEKLSEDIKGKYRHVFDKSIILGELSGYFAQTEFMMLMVSATAGGGTTRREIRECYGNHGLRVLDKLVGTGILVESDGKIVAREYDGESPFVLDHRTLKKILSYCLEHRYSPEKSGSGENWLSLQTEGVDKAKVMPLMREELDKAYNAIEKVIRSEENRGKDKIFIGMVSDSLLVENTKCGKTAQQTEVLS